MALLANRYSAARGMKRVMQDDGANARRRIVDQYQREAGHLAATKLHLQMLNTDTRYKKAADNKNKTFFSSAIDTVRKPCLVTHTGNTPYFTKCLQRLPNFGIPAIYDKAPTREAAFLYVQPTSFIYI